MDRGLLTERSISVETDTVTLGDFSTASETNGASLHLKTAVKTAACLIALGLAFITLGIIVEVISFKTQTGEHTAQHWKETPLDTFAILFFVLGVASLGFGVFMLARVALTVRKLRRNDLQAACNTVQHERTVTSVSGYVESNNDERHILESFPPLQEGTTHGFIAQFIRKVSIK